MSDKQRSYKQKCYDIVGSIGGEIHLPESKDVMELRLEAPTGFTTGDFHELVYTYDAGLGGGKTGAWRLMYQDLRYFLNNGYYTCEAKQPGSLDKECEWCDGVEAAE